MLSAKPRLRMAASVLGETGRDEEDALVIGRIVRRVGERSAYSKPDWGQGDAGEDAQAPLS